MAPPIARRVNGLPRLPFVTALAVAALLPVAALDQGGFGSDDRVSSVEELPVFKPYDADREPPERAYGEVEIVEYGFGTVLGEAGGEWGTVGAVVRNAGTEPESALFQIRFEPAPNSLTVLRDFQLNRIPVGEEVFIGARFPLPDAIPLADLSLEPDGHVPEVSATTAEREIVPAPPELTLTGIAPLFSPPGTRIEFEADLPSDEGARWSAAVLFRDRDGQIVGGLPVSPRPLSAISGWTVPLVEGQSVHHLDVPARLIPEGADLDRVEIGPSPV